MTFLKEIVELQAKAELVKKRRKEQEEIQYLKKVEELSSLITIEIERCRDQMRLDAREGKTSTLLRFSTGERPDIIAQEVAKGLRGEGFRASSPQYVWGVLHSAYVIEVGWVW